MLSIVETLKEFRTILLGQELVIHTDHKNLTFKNLTSNRVLRWRLYVEEYSPSILYVKGEQNMVADALSHFDKTEEALPDTKEAFYAICYGLEDSDESVDMYPLAYKHIQIEQQKDKNDENPPFTQFQYENKDFHGEGPKNKKRSKEL